MVRRISVLAALLLTVPLVASGSSPLRGQEDSEAKAQRQTLETMRQVGTALLAWLTDQVGAAAAKETFDLSSCEAISADEVRRLLRPEEGVRYLDDLAPVDGWGRPLELYLKQSDLLTARCALAIRSPGSDGVHEGDTYEIGPFPAREHHHDIVWGDGYFLRWPGDSAAPAR